MRHWIRVLIFGLWGSQSRFDVVCPTRWRQGVFQAFHQFSFLSFNKAAECLIPILLFILSLLTRDIRACTSQRFAYKGLNNQQPFLTPVSMIYSFSLSNLSALRIPFFVRGSGLSGFLIHVRENPLFFSNSFQIQNQEFSTNFNIANADALYSEAKNRKSGKHTNNDVPKKSNFFPEIRKKLSIRFAYCQICLDRFQIPNMLIICNANCFLGNLSTSIKGDTHLNLVDLLTYFLIIFFIVLIGFTLTYNLLYNAFQYLWAAALFKTKVKITN